MKIKYLSNVKPDVKGRILLSRKNTGIKINQEFVMKVFENGKIELTPKEE